MLSEYEIELAEVLIYLGFQDDIITAMISGMKNKYETMFFTDYLKDHPTRDKHMLTRIFVEISKMNSEEPNFFRDAYLRSQKMRTEN